MTRPVSYSVAVLLLVVLVAFSCKKKDDGPATPSGEMVGYWTLSGYGGDVNDNDTLDPQEAPPVSGTGFSGHMTLRADGTGSSYLNLGTAVTQEFRWALVDTNRSFRTIVGTDTVYRPIKTRTTSELTLFDTLAAPVGYWQLWHK